MIQIALLKMFTFIYFHESRMAQSRNLQL